MSTEPTFGRAMLGGLGYLLLLMLAPVSVGIGNATLSLWLLPLVAIHLWPRASLLGVSILLILLLGFASDFAQGFRLGTQPLIALLWFAAFRPDMRDGGAPELRLWLMFAVGSLALIALLALVTGDWRTPVPLMLDGLVAVALFPVAYRLLRLLRGWGADRDAEAFP